MAKNLGCLIKGHTVEGNVECTSLAPRGWVYYGWCSCCQSTCKASDESKWNWVSDDD